MQTVAQTDGVRYGRRAYGAQRRTTQEQRAKYIAESILLHQADGRTRTLADYGIEDKPAMAAMVAVWLTRLGR